MNQNIENKVNELIIFIDNSQLSNFRAYGSYYKNIDVTTDIPELFYSVINYYKEENGYGYSSTFKYWSGDSLFEKGVDAGFLNPPETSGKILPDRDYDWREAATGILV